MDISGNLILVEFGGIPRLVESGGFLVYIYISRNFRLVGLSRFSRFWYSVCTGSYKALLLIIGGSKYKLKAILINSYFV